MNNEVMTNNGGSLPATLVVVGVLALATYGGVDICKKVGKKVISFFKSKKVKPSEETKEE